MIPKPAELCGKCPLYEKDPNGFVRAEGTGSLGVLIMGEAGGKSERKDGLPFRFYAQAGSQLETIIKLAGYQRQQFRVGNVVNCQPPNDYLGGAAYEVEAIEHCRVHRDRIIHEMKPKCILALGEIAFRTLTGLAGEKQTISYMRGYVMDSLYGIPLVGTYHPSFIKRGNQRLTGVCINDLQRAVQVARQGMVAQSDSSFNRGYITAPTAKEAIAFYGRVRQNPGALLAYDIETPWSGQVEEDEFLDEEKEQKLVEGYDDAEITTVQFSLGMGSGICLPFIQPFVDVIASVLALPNDKVTHNGWRFDNVRLAKAQIKVNGIVHDTMWAFHHLQPDLVGHYNLQSVASFYNFPQPWKHLSKSQPEIYGCMDVDALQYIFPFLKKQMIEKGVWKGYERQVLGLEPILVGMSHRGIPVDNEARLELGTTLEGQQEGYNEDMQQLVPSELMNCKPKDGYKRVPKDTTGMTERWFNTTSDAQSKEYELNISPTHQSTLRWCRLEPFTPSSKQVLKYIKNKGHKVSHHIKTGNETADLHSLEKLFKETGDPLYETILKYRGVEKIIGTYVKGWEPKGDGRVHPEFLYKPATGQLSSTNPNAQNVPAGKGIDKGRAALARQFRRIIRAEHGYKLVEFDWKSFHGATMAFEARSPAYLRLSRLGMHDFITSHIKGEPARFDWPDDQLKDYLCYIKKKYKEFRDTQAKPAILGMQFGEEAWGLHKRYPDSFPKEKSAQPIVDLVDSLFPEVARYKEAIMRQAHSKRYLLSAFGYIRWFWNVFAWDSKWHCLKPVKGKDGDANKCKAFLPANDAFGHKKEVMLELHKGQWDTIFGLCNDIHDALLFHCPDRHVEYCIATVKPLMEAPSKVLIDPTVAPEGLWVGVETKVGNDWSEMDETD